MQPWVVALLMGLVALAGCFGDDAPADNTDGDGDGGEDPGVENPDDGDDGNQTGNETANQTTIAPVGNFTVSSNEAEAPANITFNFNASDEDSTELTWTLDVDGDGTPETEGNENNLPGNYTTTYETAGQYTATFVVSDGTSNHTLIELITITEPAGEEPEPEEEPEFEDRGEYLYEFATSMCHAKDFTSAGGVAYTSSIGGGTWVFNELNLVDGLQYQNNHPGAGTGTGFDLPVDEDCIDGDQTSV